MMWEIIVEIRDIMDTTKRINQMVNKKSKVEVFRDNVQLDSSKSITIDSDYLFPGDIVKITPNLIIPADVVLIEGKCVVSEAMLTGESVPLIKEAIQKDNLVNTNKNILF
mmetsp:Transcript_10503/g.9066  ORF Transcript_10503/g.9066 Transcript_10503/m.9066 type:complete len:110 (+) Transcript_10503:344-673(+)